LSEQAKKKKKPSAIGWPQATRDVVIASMNKGQLPLLAVAAIVLFMIFKMSSDQVSEVAIRVIERFSDYSLVGWVLAGALSFFWWFHATKTRREFNSELARIGEQKSAAQQAAAGRTLQSSRDARRG